MLSSHAVERLGHAAVNTVGFANSAVPILKFTTIYTDNFPASRGKHSGFCDWSHELMTVMALHHAG